jgi:hypothetical protein
MTTMSYARARQVKVVARRKNVVLRHVALAADLRKAAKAEMMVAMTDMRAARIWTASGVVIQLGAIESDCVASIERMRV